MRRTGTLNDINHFIERAEEVADSSDVGLNFCKGLFEWYTCNPNNALRFFNNCRRDPEFGKQSIFNMVCICIDPDNDLPTELDFNESGVDLEAEASNSRQIALKTAERLLRDLQPKTNVIDQEALNHKLMENFLLIATRTKSNVERALSNLSAITSQEELKDSIGIIYGIAVSFQMKLRYFCSG
jgi:tetratricopeptide repeat protein 21B